MNNVENTGNWNREDIDLASKESRERLQKFVDALSKRPEPDEMFGPEYYDNRERSYKRRMTSPGVKADRLLGQRCQACYFVPTFAGQAFTNSKCANCGAVIVNASTDVDTLCADCARLFSCCRRCGGIMD